MATYPSFIGPSYRSQSINVDCEVTMNLFPEQQESPGSKVPAALYPCPGFRLVWTVAQSPGRGLFATGGLVNRLFGVVGFKLYEYTWDVVTQTITAVTDRGDVAADANPATFATNGAAGGQMGITSGGVFYCYDLTMNTLTAVGTIPHATMCDFLNSRFLVLDTTTSTLYPSDLDDGLTFDLTNIIQRSTAPDPWVAMKVVLTNVWLLGSLTSDIYYNSGTGVSSDILSPYPGGRVEHGCGAPFSLQDLDQSLAWVGNDANGRGLIFRSNGYVAEPINNFPVAYALQQAPTIADAVAFTYQQDGHSFYVINFPTAQETWVQDLSTQTWHQRGYWNTQTAAFETYRVQYHANAYQQHFVLDRATGTLYTMTPDVLTDVDGSGIRRVRRAPFVGPEARSYFHQRFTLDVQPGVGTGGTQNPVVMLRWTDDGGHTWSNEVPLQAGAQGGYRDRVYANALGKSWWNRRAYEVAMTDPSVWKLAGADLDVVAGLPQ